MTYSAMGYPLTASIAFPALSLFNLLRFPVMMFPQQASRGIGRGLDWWQSSWAFKFRKCASAQYLQHVPCPRPRTAFISLPPSPLPPPPACRS